MTLIDQQKALADIIGKAKRILANSPEDLFRFLPVIIKFNSV